MELSSKMSYDIIYEIFKRSDANTKLKLHIIYNIPLGNILDHILKDKNFTYHNKLFKNKKGQIKYFEENPYHGYTSLFAVNNIKKVKSKNFEMSYDNLPEHIIYYLKDTIKFKNVFSYIYDFIELRTLFCENCSDYEICQGRTYSLIVLTKEFSNNFIDDFKHEIISYGGIILVIRLKLNNFIKTHLKNIYTMTNT